MKIKKFNELIYENLSNQEQKIINDILSTNENVGDWFSKFINYGKKGLLTAGIILSIAFSSVAQDANKTQDVIKQGIEMSDEQSKKDVYHFMIGLSNENASLSMKNGDIESAGAFKEISKHYQDLRDNKTPNRLSIDAKKQIKIMINMQKNLDENTILSFIQSGKQIKNLN